MFTSHGKSIRDYAHKFKMLPNSCVIHVMENRRHKVKSH